MRSRLFWPLRRVEASPALEIEFQSYHEYPRNYAQLARTLGNPTKAPHPDEVRLIRGLLDQRAALEGSLTLADSLFLGAFVSVISPARVLEIGTGTGFSSALMAAVLCRKRTDSPRLDTIDVHTSYLGDENTPIGREISALIPELAGAVQVHAPHESDWVEHLAKPDELECGFIDADHQHPCPLLDLLRLARVTRPGGWIVLHDIALGSLGLAAQRNRSPLRFGPNFGVEWLFQRWPFPKIAGGNIGAVQLPRDKRGIRQLVKEMMKLPFEVCRESHARLRCEIKAAWRGMS